METHLCTNPAAQHRPELSAGLKHRIARDFEPRWSRDWGGRSLLEGPAPAPDAVRLDGNDYLSVTGHPDIVSAQIKALMHGTQEVVQSGLFQREEHPARALELDLARWTGHEDALLFHSGYAANIGAMQSLADADSPVYIDTLAHASMWEGIRAAGAVAHPFRHNDPGHLERLIVQHGPGLVAVDSVYSTIGSVCPLHAVVEVVERHGCMLLVDESHSLGTHGPAGAGLVAELGLTNRVHFISASLAKAMAGRAGFITLPAQLRNYVITSSYPTMFSSCLLNHEVAGLHATVHLLQKADEARQRLRDNTRRIRARLTQLGYALPGTEQIIALEIGTEVAARALRDALTDRGVIGSIFFAPATSRNRAMVRFTMNAGLADCELDRIEQVMADIVPVFQPQNWAIARRLRKQAGGG